MSSSNSFPVFQDYEDFNDAYFGDASPQEGWSHTTPFTAAQTQTFDSSLVDQSWYYSPTSPPTGNSTYPSQSPSAANTQPNSTSQNVDSPSQLSAILFPPIIPRVTPTIPHPNPDNIHQVTSPVEDMYQPRWIRKEGRDREGWCCYCPTGRWLNLRHSNYAYHMVTRHGLTRANGFPFEPPKVLNASHHAAGGGSGSGGSGGIGGSSAGTEHEVLHAHCEVCQQWIQLTGNPSVESDHQRLTASWYTHVRECIGSSQSTS